MPEVAGDAANYFDPQSIDSMRFAIEKTVADSAEKALQIQRGHERVKQFSWNKCTLETIKVYQQLLCQ